VVSVGAWKERQGESGLDGTNYLLLNQVVTINPDIDLMKERIYF